MKIDWLQESNDCKKSHIDRIDALAIEEEEEEGPNIEKLMMS